MSRPFSRGRGADHAGNRVGRSGMTASQWGKFGAAMGVLMRKHCDKGDCNGCEFWGKKYPSPASERAFIETWGESSESIREEKCMLTPEEFAKKCPKEA